MDLYADAGRIEALEASLPALSGDDRLRAMSELAWHLRERDTRRARALALEAAALPGHDAAAQVRARIVLTLAECSRLFGDESPARRDAARALEGFQFANDRAGCEDARFLLARLGCGALDEGALKARGGAAVADRYAEFLAAKSRLQAGDAGRAIELFAHVASEALARGMDEVALQSELAIARALERLGDIEGALESAETVIARARARGWRPLLAEAVADVARWLLDASQVARAQELVLDARERLASGALSRGDARIECLLGEVQLALGDAAGAAATLSHAAVLSRQQEAAHECSHALALEARALARIGHVDAACGRAADALAIARRAKDRRAEVEALATLAALHAAHAGSGRTASTATAFLRHASEIAAEIGDAVRRSALLRELARVQEAAGDLAGALAAERSAHAEAAAAAQRRMADRGIAARARCMRERLRVDATHARALEAAKERHTTELRSAYDLFERLRAVADDIAGARDGATLVERLERHLAAFADVHVIGLFVFDRSASMLARYAREGGRAIPLRELSARDLESYAARAARERRELLVELQSARDAASPDLRDSATSWFGPVTCGDDVLGVLTVQSRRQRAYGDREQLVFRAVSGYLGLALSRARVQQDFDAQRALRIETEESLRKLSTVDPLTGLATRGQFFAVARERLQRARRDGGPCGLIVGDVDAFKSLNDTRGHEAGDRALAAVAAVIARHHRADDVAGRIGGEEFALLMPGASLAVTVEVADRIRAEVEALGIACDGRPLTLTMSFGCSALADAAADIADKPVSSLLERLVREADAALFEAQGTGGNRTIAWPAYQALRALRMGDPIAQPPQSFA